MTSHDRDAYLAGMMDAGAAGYLDKNIRAERLIEAIRRAAHGESLFAEEQISRALRWRKDVKEKWHSLSEREKEVLRLLAGGANNKAISSRLQIALKTVDKHLERIYQKLEVTSRAEAVLWGIENSSDFPY